MVFGWQLTHSGQIVGSGYAIMAIIGCHWGWGHCSNGEEKGQYLIIMLWDKSILATFPVYN